MCDVNKLPAGFQERVTTALLRGHHVLPSLSHHSLHNVDRRLTFRMKSKSGTYRLELGAIDALCGLLKIIFMVQQWVSQECLFFIHLTKLRS